MRSIAIKASGSERGFVSAEEREGASNGFPDSPGLINVKCDSRPTYQLLHHRLKNADHFPNLSTKTFQTIEVLERFLSDCGMGLGSTGG